MESLGGRDPALPQARRKAWWGTVYGAPTDGLEGVATSLATPPTGRPLRGCLRRSLRKDSKRCLSRWPRSRPVASRNVGREIDVPRAGFRAMLGTMERTRGAPAGVGSSWKRMHRRAGVQALRSPRAIVKMFAMSRLLPHVRAWSSHVALPMKSARLESPLATRAGDIGETAASLVAKCWKFLLRKVIAVAAPARCAALSSIGSAGW